MASDVGQQRLFVSEAGNGPVLNRLDGRSHRGDHLLFSDLGDPFVQQRRCGLGGMGRHERQVSGDHLARERNNLQRRLDGARANVSRLNERRVSQLFPDGPGSGVADDGGRS